MLSNGSAAPTSSQVQVVVMASAVLFVVIVGI
jgi:hypothetical protein